MHRFITIAYIAWTIALSLVTLVIYAWDKRQAKLSGRRVPEKTLHYLTLIGGWPGAYLGQWLVRHKTRKVAFRILTALAAAIHAGIIGLLIYTGLG